MTRHSVRSARPVRRDPAAPQRRAARGAMPGDARARMAALVAVLSAGALAACGSQAATGTTTGGSGATAGSRVRLAMLLTPRAALSPYSDDAFKLTRWSVGETLVDLDAAGTPGPKLATAWRRTSPTTWAFTIRSGVRFHDGTELTPQTVAAALTSAAAAKPAPRVLDGVALSARAQGAEVLVTTGAPDPLVPARLSSPQLVILAPSAYRDPNAVTPIRTGTGPFVLTAVDGTAGATLDRFDGYWGANGAAGGIDVVFVPDGTARAAALRTGSADLVEAVPASQTGVLDPAQLHEVPTPRTTTLHLNSVKGPFVNPALRGVVAAALDRSALVKSVYDGRADAAAGLLGPALPWTSQRPAPVSGLVPAAGQVPPGTAITLGTYSDRPELPELAAAIAARLERAGFTVTQVVREYAKIEQDALRGTFDAFIMSRATVLDTGDPGAYLASDYTCAGSFNVSRLCVPAIDRAVAAAAALEPGAGRQRALLAAEGAILRTGAALPLIHERVVVGASTAVSEAAFDPRERLLVTAATRVSR